MTDLNLMRINDDFPRLKSENIRPVEILCRIPISLAIYVIVNYEGFVSLSIIIINYTFLLRLSYSLVWHQREFKLTQIRINFLCYRIREIKAWSDISLQQYKIYLKQRSLFLFYGARFFLPPPLHIFKARLWNFSTDLYRVVKHNALIVYYFNTFKRDRGRLHCFTLEFL